MCNFKHTHTHTHTHTRTYLYACVGACWWTSHASVGRIPNSACKHIQTQMHVPTHTQTHTHTHTRARARTQHRIATVVRKLSNEPVDATRHWQLTADIIETLTRNANIYTAIIRRVKTVTSQQQMAALQHLQVPSETVKIQGESLPINGPAM